MKLPKIIYIVAAHNESLLLKNKMSLIVHAAQDLPIAGLILVENGSQDNTLQICQQLQAEVKSLTIDVAQESTPDLGQAWARGLNLAAAKYPSDEYFFLLTAADLPFDFSDVHEFLKLYKKSADVAVVIGSKGHPQSILHKSHLRSVLSAGFYLLRYLLLGMRVRDTQGTIFIRAPHCQKILNATLSRGFFFSTEFIFRAQEMGFSVFEVPIKLRPNERPSSIRVLRDSWRMFKMLIRLKSSRGKNTNNPRL